MNCRKSFFFSLFMAVSMLAVLAGCKPEEQEDPEIKDPSLKLSSNVVEATADGGNFSVNYVLQNPVEGAEISVEYRAGWIQNMSTEQEGRIAFDVLPNEDPVEREIKVSVIYPKVDPSPVFTVRQAAREQEENAGFSIVIRDVQPGHVKCDVTPADKEQLYVLMNHEKRYIDENGLEQDEDLWQKNLQEFRDYADMYGLSLEETVNQYYAHTGDLKDFRIDALLPETEYVAYAYGVKFTGGEMSRVTDIERISYSSGKVDMIDASFRFEYEMDECDVLQTVIPENGYEGAYFFDILKSEDVDFSDEEAIIHAAEEVWLGTVSMYLYFGMTTEEILEGICSYGVAEYPWPELLAETEYVVYAFAVNDEAFQCSEVCYEKFTTGSVKPSENVITIKVEDIQDRSCKVTYTPSNDDPFAVTLIDAFAIADCKTDEEIVAYLSANLWLPSMNYEYSEDVFGLSPNSDYVALAFGFKGGVATTDVFRHDFTTASTVEGNATIELIVGNYYDLEEVAALDDEWKDLYERGGEALLPVEAVLNPENSQVFHVAVLDVASFKAKGIDIATDDGAVVGALITSGQGKRKGVYCLPFNMEFMVCGVVADENGNYSKPWRSEVFTMTRDGAADAQEFLDLIHGTAKSPAARGIQFKGNRSGYLFIE